MAIELHPKCREQLQRVLASAFPQIVVEGAMFLDRKTAGSLVNADNVVPTDVRNRLTACVEDFPITEFVLDVLSDELWLRDKYVHGATQRLNEIEGYEDTAALAARFVSLLESLPWTYTLTFKLPSQLNELLPAGIRARPISPAASLVRPDDEFESKFPLHTSNERLNERLADKANPPGMVNVLAIAAPKPKSQWDREAVYFQIEMEGFIGHYGYSKTANNSERLARSFFGLGLAGRLFDTKFSYGSSQKTVAFIHVRDHEKKWQPFTRYELNELISKAIHGVVFHDLVRAKPEFTSYFVDGRLRYVSSALQPGLRQDQVSLAGQWYFDSFQGHDQMLSFIQCMVVMEILFGDKATSDEIGIGKLISNRFAYLVATSHEERTNLAEQFSKIYQVRSQIVHSGKHQLSIEERLLFSRLRWMCRSALSKEMDLLKAAQEDTPLTPRLEFKTDTQD